MPCVASYVGGIMDMMKGNEENLYRFEEVEMLAEKICKVFEMGHNQTDMRATAQKRHDRQNNSDTLYAIYNSIFSQNTDLQQEF